MLGMSLYMVKIVGIMLKMKNSFLKGCLKFKYPFLLCAYIFPTWEQLFKNKLTLNVAIHYH